MAKEYVYMGATLSCKMGSADSKLMMTPQHRVQQGGKFKTNIGDAKPFVNILPFGMCKSPTNPTVAAATAAAGGALQQMPCTPVCTVWMGGMANTLIDKMPALMDNDKLLCTFGAGMITIKDSGQGAPGKGAGGAGKKADKGGDSGEGKAKEVEKSTKFPKSEESSSGDGSGGSSSEDQERTTGGSYKDCKKASDGNTEQVHHMPADAASPLATKDGPCITMDKEDHKKTASFDNKPGSQEYRDAQKDLIKQGKFKEAMQMDVDDVKKKFPGKYDKSIGDALKYAENLSLEGMI
jgi:hypothetical protein